VYQWWVIVHLVGVFGFLIAHGVSIAITFRLRKERDPRRVADLLELSGSTIRVFYVSLFVLLLGGVIAGFLQDWWSQGWIWAALLVLILASLSMFFMARPYYRRVGLVARAMAGGSSAVSNEQFDEVLRSSRPVWIMGIGVGALALILYLMVLKPTLGLGAGPATTPTETPGGGGLTIQITSKDLAFDTNKLSVSGSAPFSIVFDNEDRGIPHNVAIYTDSSGATPLFVGGRVDGRRTVIYRVRALPQGTYFFRCDFHHQMNGILTAT
jgi:plastocyanin